MVASEVFIAQALGEFSLSHGDQKCLVQFLTDYFGAEDSEASLSGC